MELVAAAFAVLIATVIVLRDAARRDRRIARPHSTPRDGADHGPDPAPAAVRVAPPGTTTTTSASPPMRQPGPDVARAGAAPPPPSPAAAARPRPAAPPVETPVRTTTPTPVAAPARRVVSSSAPAADATTSVLAVFRDTEPDRGTRAMRRAVSALLLAMVTVTIAAGVGGGIYLGLRRLS